MTYLVLGARGMLGRAITELCARERRPYKTFERPAFDLNNPEHVEEALSAGAEAVFNCVAYTNVDAAEADEATATRVNGEAVAALAQACAKRAIPLVHYSTDYVFSGDASEPYPVDAPHAPVGAYGRSKAMGERGVWEADGPHLLLRTSWVYAPWGNNFVRTMFKLSRERESLRVVSDQRGRPSSAEHLARVSLALLDRNVRGTLHVSDGGECTWYEFASEIVRLSGHSCVVTPCTSAEFPRPARRPAYSVLDLGRTEALLGPMPHYRDNLRDVMARLEPV